MKVKIIIPAVGVKPHAFDYDTPMAKAMQITPPKAFIKCLPVKLQ